MIKTAIATMLGNLLTAIAFAAAILAVLTKTKVGRVTTAAFEAGMQKPQKKERKVRQPGEPEPPITVKGMQI